MLNHFNKLPKTILSYIVKFLDNRSRVAFTHTCRRFRAIHWHIAGGMHIVDIIDHYRYCWCESNLDNNALCHQVNWYDKVIKNVPIIYYTEHVTNHRINLTNVVYFKHTCGYITVQNSNVLKYINSDFDDVNVVYITGCPNLTRYLLHESAHKFFVDTDTLLINAIQSLKPAFKKILTSCFGKPICVKKILSHVVDGSVICINRCGLRIVMIPANAVYVSLQHNNIEKLEHNCLFTRLKYLNVNGNKLQKLTLNAPNLTTLDIRNNNITSIDLSGYPQLTSVCVDKSTTVINKPSNCILYH